MRRAKSSKIMTYVIAAILILTSIFIYSFQKEKSRLAPSGDSSFTVYMIDVGQGDCAFIDNGDKDILIDAGTNESSDDMVSTLYELGVEDIEYVFFTHPHEDHIGGGDEILRNFDVKNVVMPDAESDTACYRDVMHEIENTGARLEYACAGDKFKIGDADFDILSPEEGAFYSNENLYSLMIRIQYGDVKYLFAGDAEKHNENIVLEDYYDMLDCDVLSVGHHGSYTSSGKDFLEAVSPEIALISVGEGNMYGHPHTETLAELKNYTENIYRTDRHGTVIIGSDGKRLWVEDKN
ncbi:MAG: MBL fold metallo-hydrolase [Ruminococcaceae bacterium]|nr:MBL fold metallo-hydrolase [Oscillospiraceae bacterium]